MPRKHSNSKGLNVFVDRSRERLLEKLRRELIKPKEKKKYYKPKFKK